MPRNRSRRRVACDQSKPSAPFLMKARGVAEVTASAPRHAEELHVVMAPVNDMSMNARAARAGLKGLYPSPPNACFATPIANTPPAPAIHSGRSGGRLSARRRPVRTDERSPIVFSRFIARRQRASVTMHDATHVPIRNAAFSPKNQIEQAVAGRSAMITSSMSALTPIFACVCGELERT